MTEDLRAEERGRLPILGFLGVLLQLVCFTGYLFGDAFEHRLMFEKGSAELRLEALPNPATTEQTLVVTVSGVASCPKLTEQEILDGAIEIGFYDQCPTPPPDPTPFTEVVVLGSVAAGHWEIRLIDLDQPEPTVADVEVVLVNEPLFELELTPSPASEADLIATRMTGIGSDVFFDSAVVDGNVIRLLVSECGICDPPSPSGSFELVEQIGPLAVGAYVVEYYFGSEVVAASTLEVKPVGACFPGPTTLCLNNSRFRVEVAWTTMEGISDLGQAVEETPDTGFFWFFSPNNIELMVKVLDGCDDFGTYWVFAGGLTDVGVALAVVDTETGARVDYESPVGERYMTITDTAAFATCP